MSSSRDWAQRYAQLGLRVVPIPPGKKYPAGVDAWQTEATCELERIDQLGWWAGAEADDGIGLALGQHSSGAYIFAIDIDMHEADGEAAWQELCRLHAWKEPATWVSLTGGGGRHIFFAAMQEVTNANQLPDGIDVRGAGGQVVVEPSWHPSGTQYAWEDGCEPWSVKLAAAPDWLLELLVPDPIPDTDETIDPFLQGVASDDPFADSANDRPGDRWAASVTWRDLLERDGWVLHHTDKRTGELHWTRPGKKRSEGTSATTGYGSHDVLKVFTSSMAGHGLQAERTYSKMGYIAATRYAGDHSAMARELVADGWRPPAVDLTLEGSDPFASPAQPPAGSPGQDEPQEWHKVAPRPIPKRAQAADWPRDVLPGWMQDQVDNVSESMQCAPDLPGMYALGALSVAAIGHVELQVRGGHQEPVTLWLVTPAPPAEAKTPAQRAIFAPLHAVEDQEVSRRELEVAKAHTRLAIAEKAAKRAEDAAAKADDPLDALDRAAELRAAILDIEVPTAGRLMTSDATPEKLAALMQENGESLAIVSDESGALAFDRYGDKKRGSNLDIYLSSWSGGRVTVDRVTAPPVKLKRPLLTIVIGAQPEAWARALDDDEFRTRGLGARFMAATPEARAHLRDQSLQRDVWSQDIAEHYQLRMTELAQKWLGWQNPAVLHLAGDCSSVWDGWAHDLARARAEGGELENDSAWVSKMQDTVLRTAALLHLADGSKPSEPVPAAVLARAQRLGDYWRAHRLRDTGDLSSEPMRLLRTLCRIADADGKVQKLELKQRGSRGLRTADEVHEHLELLSEYGWLKVTWPGMPAGRQGWWRVSGWVVHLHPMAVGMAAATSDHQRPLLTTKRSATSQTATNGGQVGQVAYSRSEALSTTSFPSPGDTSSKSSHLPTTESFDLFGGDD